MTPVSAPSAACSWSRRWATRHDSMPKMPPGTGADRCAAYRSASRGCSTWPAATSPTAPTSATARWPLPTRRSCGGCVTPAPWWWGRHARRVRLGHHYPARHPWLDAQPPRPHAGARRLERRVGSGGRRGFRAPRRRQRRGVRSGSRPRSAGSSGSRRRTAGSAGPAAWPSPRRSTRPVSSPAAPHLLAAALAATAGADPDDPATVATPPLDDLVGPSDLATRTSRWSTTSPPRPCRRLGWPRSPT